MKKIITILCLLVFSANVLASPMSGLKEAIDEINYGLTVEWDQKDQVFYENQVSLFAERIAQLRAEGLTNKELIEESLSLLKDETRANQMRRIMTQVNLDQMSLQEIQQMILETYGSSFPSGASWNAREDLIFIGAGLIFVVVMWYGMFNAFAPSPCASGMHYDAEAGACVD